MKKTGSLLLSAFVAATFTSSTLMADAAAGQKLYLNQLKVCEKDGVANGGKFSTKHDRDTWENMKEDGKLVGEWKSICPSGASKFDALNDADKANLYDFCWQFAADGDVPSCG